MLAICMTITYTGMYVEQPVDLNRTANRYQVPAVNQQVMKLYEINLYSDTLPVVELIVVQ